jgi:hypothetical protein
MVEVDEVEAAAEEGISRLVAADGFRRSSLQNKAGSKIHGRSEEIV